MVLNLVLLFKTVWTILSCITEAYGGVHCSLHNASITDAGGTTTNTSILLPPKIVWGTELIQNKLNPDFVVLSGFHKPKINPQKWVVQILCTALQPIEIIFQETLNSSFSNPSAGATRNTKIPFAEYIEDFNFGVAMVVGLGHITTEKSIQIQCNYVENPCLGKTVYLKYYPGNETITLKLEDLQSNSESNLQMSSQINSAIIDDKMTKKRCDAYFYYKAEPYKIDNLFAPYSMACSFEDGTPGKIEIPKLFLASVIRNSFLEINFQPRKCWKPLLDSNNDVESEDKNFNNSCANCVKVTLENLYPVVPICVHPTDDENARRKLKIGSFAFFGIPRNDVTGIADIVLPGQELPPESMITILISGSGQNQILNTTIQVACVFSNYYLSNPFRFAMEYENDDGNGTSLEFEADTPFKWTVWKDLYTTYIVFIKTTKLKRIYCLAPLHRRNQWINATRPITVSIAIKPFFLNDVAAVEDLLEENGAMLPVIDVSFDVGAENKNITCRAGGLPLPKISWSRANNTFKESISGVLEDLTSMNYSQAWSEIHFSKITAATSGEYICHATNDFGKASTIFRIAVAETSSFMLIIYLVSAAFSVVLLVCGGFAIMQARRLRQQGKIIRSLTDEEIQEFFEGNQTLSLDDPQHAAFSKAFDQSYEIAKDRLLIEKGKHLGSGNFGTVMQGYIVNEPKENCVNYVNTNTTVVAVKTVKSNVDVMHVKSLLSEIKIMAFLGAHSNIVQLLGTVTENIRKGKILVAVEFCSNGDLRNFLKKIRNNFKNISSSTTSDVEDSYLRIAENDTTAIPLKPVVGLNGTDADRIEVVYENTEASEVYTTKDLLKWSVEIANGLIYLSQKKVIHGDLAARNILLTDTKTAKISDFGLSKQLLNDYTVYAKKSDTPLPWKWLALEALKFQNFSIQSDTWSFGMVLWEIFSMAEIPYPGCHYDENFLEKLEGGFRLYQPQLANVEVYKIMAKCWEKEPESRPDAQNIHKDLTNLIAKCK